MDRVESDIAGYRKTVNDLVDKYDREYVSDAEDKRRLEKVRAALTVYYAQWEPLRALSRQTATDPTKEDEAAKLMVGASSKAFADVDGRVIPEIRGRAYVNSEATLIVQDDDPLAMGIRG